MGNSMGILSTIEEMKSAKSNLKKAQDKAYRLEQKRKKEEENRFFEKFRGKIMEINGKKIDGHKITIKSKVKNGTKFLIMFVDGILHAEFFYCRNTYKVCSCECECNHDYDYKNLIYIREAEDVVDEFGDTVNYISDGCFSEYSLENDGEIAQKIVNLIEDFENREDLEGK